MQGTTPTNRLRPIGEDMPASFFDTPQGPGQIHEPAPPPQPNPAMQNAATQMLLLSLRALSQRTIVALGNLFVLLTAASAWLLWKDTLPQPSIPQLVGLALYGALILALDYLVLRRA